MKPITRLRVGLVGAIFIVASASAATITVTNTNDSGAGSLRQAILNSNASVGVLDTIQFNIPGGGVHIIAPATTFAAISDPVVIDGYTQPGASPNTLTVGDNAVIQIQINGSPGISIGLNVGAGNTTIRGIAIANFPTAITMSGAGSNVVEGCFLGINPAGTAAAANNAGIRITITSPNCRIGGALPAQRNLISGQTGLGIDVNSANNPSILGNYIGTDRTGTVGVGNVSGIVGSGTNVKVGGAAAGEGNLISGNGAAIVVGAPGGGWTIAGNLIGTDVTGTVALGNSGIAVDLGGSNNNTVGGTTTASRNIISANDRAISINGGDGNVIQGNYIGTDVTGTVPLGNIRYGIATGNSSQNTIIGGLTTVAGQPPGNLIAATQGTASPIGDLGSGITTNAGNGSPGNSAAGTLIQGNLIGTDKNGFRALGNRIGVFLGEPGTVLGGTDPRASNVISGNFSPSDGGVVVANNNDVIGNLIGTDISGLHPLGNASNGILIKGGNSGAVQQNVIAYNAASGVRITAGTGYRIVGNAIYDNQLPGIDLGTAGSTPNDNGDADAGANNLQNFPVITSANNDGTNTTIVGTLNSTPNTTFTLEFFVSSVRDASGFGQAENVLNTASVTTNASGNAPFNLTFAQLNDGQWITATATDPGGNTSEFSAAVAVTGPVILNASTVTARTGKPFHFRVFTAGGTNAQRLAATGLPPGLSANAISGLISGTPTADGSYNVLLTVTDGGITTTATLEIVCVSDPALPVIVSSNVAVVPTGQPFSYPIDAPATTVPGDVTSFSIFGPLPPGLTFNPTTGIISGTALALQGNQVDSVDAVQLDGGSLLSVIQLFANNSAGRTAWCLLFLRLPPMPVNISTRLSVGTDENVLIAGFIVTGNAPKIVIVRGIGPTLGANGVTGALQDPVLELHDAKGALLAVNDNWRSDQEAEIKETKIPPSDERESAIVALLEPANYTAVFRGANRSTGVGLVEAYDLGIASMNVTAVSQFANLSTRGLVGTNDNVMIGGVIAANGTAKFLLRAIGPSLGGAGVQGALQDPILELHGANGATLASNDNWKIRSDGTSQEAEIRATTVPPSHDLESALIQSVAPGNYTAIVRGKNNSTGVALVELYNLQ